MLRLSLELKHSINPSFAYVLENLCLSCGESIPLTLISSPFIWLEKRAAIELSALKKLNGRLGHIESDGNLPDDISYDTRVYIGALNPIKTAIENELLLLVPIPTLEFVERLYSIRSVYLPKSLTSAQDFIDWYATKLIDFSLLHSRTMYQVKNLSQTERITGFSDSVPLLDEPVGVPSFRFLVFEPQHTNGNPVLNLNRSNLLTGEHNLSDFLFSHKSAQAEVLLTSNNI